VPTEDRVRRVVAIGNFDGVHLGHQAVLRDVAADAARRGAAPAVLTFSPHPVTVLGVVLGRPAPPTLTSLDRKVELLHAVEPAITPFVQRFDLAFAAQEPEAFVTRTLVRALDASVVVVGQNFRFGHARRGDFAELCRLGRVHGFETRSHPLVGDEGGSWSSSRVREALARGDLDAATRMLGRPHMLSGVVVQGDRRGRTIGFPTANLAHIEEGLPRSGVYAVVVDRSPHRALPGGAEQPDLVAEPARAPSVALAKGVANVGVRPTITPGETRPSVEVHLFDFAGDLYGARLRVHLVARLRDEQRFAGLDALKAQIAKDAADARAWLAAFEHEPGDAWF
jgi:riboflavin kinase/FMN adenylyltransferase